MTAPPLRYQWSGEAMEITRAHRRMADREFVIGAFYTMVEHQERSQSSHNHFHAIVQTAWQNLREEDAERFPTADHLRKYALIRAGYRDERTIVCASKAEAQRMAAFMKPLDEYAIITASEAAVRVWTAKSQSYKAMGKADFQASKDAVIGVLAGMIDVDPTTLTHQVQDVSSKGAGAKVPVVAG